MFWFFLHQEQEGVAEEDMLLTLLLRVLCSFGNFFGPSVPSFSDRGLKESKSLFEIPSFAQKASNLGTGVCELLVKAHRLSGFHLRSICALP